MPSAHFSIVANRTLGGEKMGGGGEKETSASKNYLRSFHLFFCSPLQGCLHHRGHFQGRLDNLEVHVVPSAS